MINKYIYQKIYILFLISIFISSIYLKFSYVTDIFTEYDDIGVITLFKGFLGSKIINLDFLFLDKKIILDEYFFSNFEDNFLLPVYIFWEWTYTPFQYLFYLLANIQSQDVETKILIIRLPSIIFSLLSIVIFLIILNKLKYSKTTKLISLCLLAYSFNANIYANHAAPYALYIFSGFFGLYNLLNYYKRDCSKKYILINNLTLYLSYTNIILFIGFIYIEFKKKNLFLFSLNLLKKHKVFLFVNVLIFLPILVKFLFSNHTSDMLYRSNYYNEELFWGKELFINLYPVLKFIIVGFVNETFLPIIILVLLIIFLIFIKSKKFKLNILTKCSIIFLIFWIFLSAFRIIPFGETRHSMILMPFVLMIFSDIFENLLPDKKILLIPIFFLIINSTLSNLNVLNSKKTNFEFSKFNKSDLNIYTYSLTLEPFLLNNYSGKIYNTDLNAFINNDKLINTYEDEFYLVSTWEKLSDKLKKKHKFFNNLTNQYTVNTISEVTTNTTRSYNNSCCETTGKNNFYLYKLTKK